MPFLLLNRDSFLPSMFPGHLWFQAGKNVIQEAEGEERLPPPPTRYLLDLPLAASCHERVRLHEGRLSSLCLSGSILSSPLGSNPCTLARDMAL